MSPPNLNVVNDDNENKVATTIISYVMVRVHFQRLSRLQYPIFGPLSFHLKTDCAADFESCVFTDLCDHTTAIDSIERAGGGSVDDDIGVCLSDHGSTVAVCSWTKAQQSRNILQTG